MLLTKYLRMDHTVLKSTENLDRLISVAPSSIDAQKIREYQEAHPNVQLNEDEQFLTTVGTKQFPDLCFAT